MYFSANIISFTTLLFNFRCVVAPIPSKMKKQKRFTTGFLFSTPSFLSGAGTVMNLAGNFYDFNFSESGFEADKMAIENDFRMLGQDIFDAIEKVNDDDDDVRLVLK